MTIDTWVSLSVLLAALIGFYAAIRREMKGELRQLRADLRSDIGSVRTELGSVRTEVRGEIADLRMEIKGDIAELRTELKSDIHRLDHRVEMLDGRIYDLAIGIRPLIETAQRSPR